jgi:hypothetical protein
MRHSTNTAFYPTRDAHFFVGLEFGEADDYVAFEDSSVYDIGMPAPLVASLDAPWVIIEYPESRLRAGGIELVQKTVRGQFDLYTRLPPIGVEFSCDTTQRAAVHDVLAKINEADANSFTTEFRVKFLYPPRSGLLSHLRPLARLQRSISEGNRTVAF